jgi:hypothetical protein
MVTRGMPSRFRSRRHIPHDPAGSAAAVPIAKGNQEVLQAPLLHPGAPDAAQLLGIGAVV